MRFTFCDFDSFVKESIVPPFYKKSQFYSLLPATFQDKLLQSLSLGLNTLDGFVFASNNLSSQKMRQIMKETAGILNR